MTPMHSDPLDEATQPFLQVKNSAAMREDSTAQNYDMLFELERAYIAWRRLSVKLDRLQCYKYEKHLKTEREGFKKLHMLIYQVKDRLMPANQHVAALKYALENVQTPTPEIAPRNLFKKFWEFAKKLSFGNKDDLLKEVESVDTAFKHALSSFTANIDTKSLNGNLEKALEDLKKRFDKVIKTSKKMRAFFETNTHVGQQKDNFNRHFVELTFLKKEAESHFCRINNLLSEVNQANSEIKKFVDEEKKNIRANAVGLALSGGGIRSATVALGVLQALAHENRLKRVDYLSSVSGGGYIATALSWWLSDGPLVARNAHSDRADGP